MTPYKILVTDDEEAIRHFLKASLSAYGHTLIEAESGMQALSLMVTARPDLMILDLGLPDLDGVDVIREVRADSQLPIIVLSVRSREQEKIQALDAGADDYLTKPFGVGELLARIRVVMRRGTGAGDEGVLEAGGLSMDLTAHKVSVEGREVALTPTEFDLLKLLLANAGKVLTHKQIIQKIWGTHTGDEGRLLRVNISNLRGKIEPDLNRPKYIRTELGVGYRLNGGDKV